MNHSRLLTAACLLLTLAVSGHTWAEGVARAEPPSPDAESATNGKTGVYNITKNIKFNEGSVVGRNAILLSNFGGDELDPLNADGKGYIVALDRNGSSILIPADGTLNAPKGMAVKDDYLFVADVGCVIIYNLKKLDEKPIKIQFPKDDLFVNDIIAIDDMLLISVTNTGRLYTIDATNPERLDGTVPVFVASIAGANGLAERDGILYIASYNPSEVPDHSNVIYSIDITLPGAKLVNMLGDRMGQYDGLALNKEGTRLYFSNWLNSESKAEVGYIDLKNGNAVTIMDLGVELQGPADITLEDEYLYIPDLPASKLHIVEIK